MAAEVEDFEARESCVLRGVRLRPCWADAKPQITVVERG